MVKKQVKNSILILSTSKQQVHDQNNMYLDAGLVTQELDSDYK